VRQTAPLPSSPVGKADTGEVDDMLKLPGAGMLIPAEKGFFLARAANGAATFEPVGKADTGPVYEVLELPGAGILISTYKGWFLARAANGAATFEPVGKVDTGQVDDMLKLPGGRQSRHRLGVRHPRVPWGGDADPGR